jgi:dynein heavy chain
VVQVATRLVPMTIGLWNRTQAKMLPTPAKFHYLFNIRELSKVFQGVILASRDRFSRAAPRGGYGGGVASPEGYLLALWLHECRWGVGVGDGDAGGLGGACSQDAVERGWVR